MPTGYTADVQSGKITEFDDFVWRCARGMGALIMMRDEPSGAPIPERFEPSTDYHDRSISKAEGRLSALRAMDLPAMREGAQQAYAASVKSAADYASGKEVSRRRYQDMLAKVSAWVPPTDEHVGLKDFMASQLKQSIDFDCYEGHLGDEPKKLEPQEWHDAEVAEAERQIAYHTKARSEEIERTEGRNQWLAELRRSLAA